MNFCQIWLAKDAGCLAGSQGFCKSKMAEVNALIQRPLALASDRRNGHSRQSITLRLAAFCIADVSERIKGTYPPTLNLIALSFYT